MPSTNISATKSLSWKQAKRIQSYIAWLYYFSKKKEVYSKATDKKYWFKLNFITLTLSNLQFHDDYYILKNLFEPFIRELRTKKKGLLYVWKVEVQDNGNIHFHINTNYFLHHKYIRDVWNKYQSKHGYINHELNANPNSTDVRSVMNASELSNYMAKYMAKGDVRSKILKRYFKIYGSRIMALKSVYNFPKNYNKHLKRKVTIKKFDCSNAIKSVKIVVEGIDNSTYEAFESYANFYGIKHFDYCSMVHVWDYTKIPFNSIREKIRVAGLRCIEAEKQVPKAFEIE